MVVIVASRFVKALERERNPYATPIYRPLAIPLPRQRGDEPWVLKQDTFSGYPSGMRETSPVGHEREGTMCEILRKLFPYVRENCCTSD